MGGGVTFGPRNNKNYKQSINKKEGRLAISSLIQNRASLISVVKDLESAMPEISTKKAKELIVSLTGEVCTTGPQLSTRGVLISRCLCCALLRSVTL